MRIDRRRLLLGSAAAGMRPGLFGQAPASGSRITPEPYASEVYHDRLARVLASWARMDPEAIEKSLAPGFVGPSFQPASERQLLKGVVEVRRVTFAPPTLGAAAFVAQFREAYRRVELQITRIDGRRTRVKYDLVGREQRSGYWDLEWTADDRVRLWRAGEETRSRARGACFEDVTLAAIGPSEQLAHGADYWRTVLDAASGIDIYGHHGVSMGDIDGDGFDDLYICQPGGLPNRLYRNRGDGTFEDITEGSGVGILENTACALFIDVDNNGRQDLVVVRANGPLLFLNQGGGKFRLKPGAFRFANPPQGTFTGAAAADYNRDGFLDIYFCLYVYYQGTDQYKYPVPYFDANNGPPNFLFRNNGDGTFQDVTKQSGLDRNNTRYSFCCGWNDFNGDGWPDLYVVNDFGRKNLYRNNGDGTFTDVAAEAGVEDVGAGMSVCWADYNNDGKPDLYSADMWTAAGERITALPEFRRDSPAGVRMQYRKHAMGNSLFRNNGRGFDDVTAASGAGNGRWAWSSDAWDFDHDGRVDLYIANGMISGAVREDLNSYFWRNVVATSPDDATPSHAYEQGWSTVNERIRADHSWSGYERNVLFANLGDGTFTDIAGAVGLDFPEDGRSFALADFDRDGRQECFLKNRNAPQLRVLRNVIEGLPGSIGVSLRGTKSNRDAIGAVVRLGEQMRTVQAGSGFLSQHSKELFFGLGEAAGPFALEIRWPSGLTQRIENVPANHRVAVIEGGEHRLEPFRTFRGTPTQRAAERPGEHLPGALEAWLLVPIAAPDAVKGPALLALGATLDVPGVRLAPISDARAPVYGILFKFLFDRHRDLTPPAGFLVDEAGQIVKVYQGSMNALKIAEDARRIPRTQAQRMALALPFPGDADTYEFARNQLSYGSAFFQREYYAEAGAFFRAALKDDPASAEAVYGVGSVALKLGNTSEARASFERAVRMQAGYLETKPNALNNLGLLATREGDLDGAIGYFEEALRLYPDLLVALENLGNAYRQQKRFELARGTLEHAAAVAPGNAEVQYSLGMVFAQTGDTARAYELLQRAITLRPAYPEALNNLGILYLRTQLRDKAVASFEEAIRVAPDFDQAYLNLAMVDSIEGRPADARALLTALLKRQPQNAAARQALEKLR